MSAHRIPLRERLVANSIPVPEAGCWLWTGGEAKGYGRTSMLHKNIAAHRASYQEFCGEIPEGMHVCHKCDTPLCINPDHLFLGSPLANAMDKVSKGRQWKPSRKTHCINGHEFTPQNTYTRLTKGGSRRTCRECNTAAVLRSRRKGEQA
jgi:hypothetical protein